MFVNIVLPTNEVFSYSFSEGNVPRQYDYIRINDPECPRAEVKVENVEWRVTERGCNEVFLYVN